ncbi:UAA transporter family-domain-containing protein [Pholiota molesta]|nr:UAA transporter family-domain-containing protein [Pholiota molesta]
MLSLISSWVTTISLIFGGCCSNAITLEQLTLEHPNAGSVITFFQFLVISLYGLPKFLVWTRFGPGFRPRRVPISTYLVQVALFYMISLLNNAAFAYNIPMAVHIIFRSGGLIISLILGWLIPKKKYSRLQIASVLLVTMGVILTTLSAQSSSVKNAAAIDTYKYATGILILTLALVLKSLFYLHFLSLPLFLPLLPDILAQLDIMNSTGPQAQFSLPIPIPTSVNLSTPFPMDIPPPFSIPRLPIHLFPLSKNASLLAIAQAPLSNDTARATGLLQYPFLLSFSVPHIYLPLLMNTLTQLFCVAGVHRLTTRVSALTVTLVLVVRKAVSLIVSVLGVSEVGRALRCFALASLRRLAHVIGLPFVEDGGKGFRVFGVDVDPALSLIGSAFVGTGAGKRPQEVDNRMMWTGAALVLLGTIGYTIGSTRPKARASVKVPGKDKNKVE